MKKKAIKYFSRKKNTTVEKKLVNTDQSAFGT